MSLARKECNICTHARPWPDMLKPKSYSLLKGNQPIGEQCSWILSSRPICFSFGPFQQLKDIMTRDYGLWVTHGSTRSKVKQTKHLHSFMRKPLHKPGSLGMWKLHQMCPYNLCVYVGIFRDGIWVTKVLLGFISWLWVSHHIIFENNSLTLFKKK